MLFAIGGAAMLFSGPVVAQEYVIPQIWGNGLLGQSAMEVTRQNLERYHGEDGDSSERATPENEYPGCSADALPADDRRRMEAEYSRRLQSDGKQSADAWVHHQGRQFHQKLVDDGTCPAQ